MAKIFILVALLICIKTVVLEQNLDEIADECGIQTYHPARRLRQISSSEKSFPGEWPWLVAILKYASINFQFQCSGSILTNKHVITAGHCLKVDNIHNDTLPPGVLLVVLGRYNLTHWRERGSLNLEVASFAIHPDYAHYLSGDSDLAILTLRRSVQYGPHIRPICLWSGSIDLQDVVNKEGYVVGWRDNYQEPRTTKMSILTENCLQSNQAFYLLTSNNTFCAGGRNESGPCNVDSGSGLFIFNDTTRSYHLRGIASRTLFSDDYLCNVKNNFVFVDVAKYIPWIQQQINRN